MLLTPSAWPQTFLLCSVTAGVGAWHPTAGTEAHLRPKGALWCWEMLPHLSLCPRRVEVSQSSWESAGHRALQSIYTSCGDHETADPRSPPTPNCHHFLNTLRVRNRQKRNPIADIVTAFELLGPTVKSLGVQLHLGLCPREVVPDSPLLILSRLSGLTSPLSSALLAGVATCCHRLQN